MVSSTWNEAGTKKDQRQACRDSQNTEEDSQGVPGEAKLQRKQSMQASSVRRNGGYCIALQENECTVIQTLCAAWLHRGPTWKAGEPDALMPSNTRGIRKCVKPPPMLPCNTGTHGK